MSNFDHTLHRIEWGVRGLACFLFAGFVLQWILATA